LTLSVASDPEVIEAVICFVPGSYAHDSSAAPAELEPMARTAISAAPRTARNVVAGNAAFLSPDLVSPYLAREYATARECSTVAEQD
jgi:hypothetical protein